MALINFSTVFTLRNLSLHLQCTLFLILSCIRTTSSEQVSSLLILRWWSCNLIMTSLGWNSERGWRSFVHYIVDRSSCTVGGSRRPSLSGHRSRCLCMKSTITPHSVCNVSILNCEFAGVVCEDSSFKPPVKLLWLGLYQFNRSCY